MNLIENMQNIFISLSQERCLKFGSPEADAEKGIHVQVIY